MLGSGMFASVTGLGLALLLPSAVLGNHLSGPMQDRLDSCMAVRCPGFAAAMDSPMFQDLAGNISFNQFLSPPYNSFAFLSDTAFVLSVIGFNNDTFMYNDEPGTPGRAGGTAGVATQDWTAHFRCACERCASTVEAIFQPAGRPMCTALGYALPCAAEVVACQVAYPDPTGVFDGEAGAPGSCPACLPNWGVSSVCQPGTPALPATSQRRAHAILSPTS